MTGEQFTAWMKMMGFRKGDAAASLGIGRNTVPAYMKDGAPRYIALACAAISMGLPEWGSAAGHAAEAA